MEAPFSCPEKLPYLTVTRDCCLCATGNARRHTSVLDHGYGQDRSEPHRSRTQLTAACLCDQTVIQCRTTRDSTQLNGTKEFRVRCQNPSWCNLGPHWRGFGKDRNKTTASSFNMIFKSAWLVSSRMMRSQDFDAGVRKQVDRPVCWDL